MTIDWRDSREEYLWLGALAVLTLAAFAIATAAGDAVGLQAWRIAFSYIKVIWVLGPAAMVWVAGLIVLRLLASNIRRPHTEVMPYLKCRFGSPARLVATLLPILVIPALMGSFGTLKMLMPLAREFTWDDWLANADKVLFMGYQPWQFTHALFGDASATKFIDTAYSLWVALLFTAVLFYALLAPRYERARFFLAFAASWLLIGVGGAYFFASAGPCYSAQIGALAAPDFAPLMDRLREIHDSGYRLGAYRWQQVLWFNHSNQRYGFGMGISAMPSMHNAITVLYALSLGRMPRPVRLAAWGFVALIFVGSVHLGWHYALDGIVAGVMMVGVWKGAGAFLDRIGYSAALAGEGAGLAGGSEGERRPAAA